MEKQEYIMRLSMLQQEAERFEQQIQLIDQQINELGAVNESLESIKSHGLKKEILANLGKGVFIQAEIKDADNVFVNVGKEVLVKKTIDETMNLIREQLKRLMEGKEDFMKNIQELQSSMEAIVKESESSENLEKEKKKCSKEKKEKCDDCGDDCRCEN